MNLKNEFQQITDRHKRESDKRIAQIEKDTSEFNEENRYLTAEWRQYLYKYILLLGGILSFLIALSSANLIKKNINPEDFFSALKFIFSALILSILAILYSIFKERENMWGRIYIKSADHADFDRKCKRLARIKKFLWVIFPLWFKNMEEMNGKLKEETKKKGWKFGYFSDFKRRYTDFRVFKYAFGLNDGVVWYGRIFGILSTASIIFGIFGIYKLLLILNK